MLKIDTARETINRLLSEVKCGEFPRPERIISVSSEMTVEEAVNVLSKHRFLSAPVYNPAVPRDAPWNEKYLGILDLPTIVGAILEGMGPELKNEKSPYYEEDIFAHFLKRKAHESLILRKKVFDVLRFGRCCSFIPMHPDSTLWDAMLVMGKFGVHRLPIVEKDGDIINLITQSAIVEMLAEALGESFDVFEDFTVSELGLDAPSKVITVKINMPTFEAFQQIYTQGVSAVGVTGEYGALVGVVSARDIQLALRHNKLYNTMHEPVREFLEAKTCTTDIERNPAVTCVGSDTIKAVILKITAAKVHRVFVVDEDEIPIRCVSLTDIIKIFVIEPKDWMRKHIVNGIDIHFLDNAPV